MGGNQGLLRQYLGSHKEHLYHCGKGDQQLSFHSMEYDKDYGRNRDEFYKDSYYHSLECHQNYDLYDFQCSKERVQLQLKPAKDQAAELFHNGQLFAEPAIHTALFCGLV